MKFRIKYADQIVGTLSLLAIAALIFILFLIGSKQKWFVPKHPYHTIVNSASNVSEGMAIQYKGFGIGKVTTIELDEKDQVVVNFYISDEYIDRITEGSILELVVNPIGLGSSLIFHQGVSSTIIEDDSLIPEKASDEGKNNIASRRVIITDQADSITAVFNSVAELINNVNSLVTDLNGILDGTKTESPLSETIGEINTILNQVSLFLAGDDSVPLAKIVDSLNVPINKLNNILSDVNGVVNQFQDTQGLIPKLLESEESQGAIDNLFTSLNQTINDINTISSSLGNNMPQITVILTQVQTLIKQVQDVVVALKNNPLIKGNATERAEQTSATPKLREESF